MLMRIPSQSLESKPLTGSHGYEDFVPVLMTEGLTIRLHVSAVSLSTPLRRETLPIESCGRTHLRLVAHNASSFPICEVKGQAS